MRMEWKARLVNDGTQRPQQRGRGWEEGKVFTVDATRIALDTIGRNIPNVPMLGALLNAVEIVGKEGILAEIRSRLGARVGKKVAEANIKAFKRAYDETKEG